MKIILCGCLTKAFPDIETAADEVIIGKFAESLPVSLQSERTRAFLKIQDGCNRSCAYCIIPKARPDLHSRSIPEIVTEAQILANAGHKEIVITGINLCLYEYGLVNVIESIGEVASIKRIRLGSLEPDLITESDIIKLSKIPKLCNHFHLSLQSGSNTVLQRMNRRYTTDEYRNIVGRLRTIDPTAAITTDIIAGFPGETEAEFAQTLEFAEEMRFAKIHTFAFSSREGTIAATMPNQIPKSIKRERVSKLSELADSLRLDFFKGLIGTTQEVLMEKENLGHTSCYTPVKTLQSHNKNDIVKVEIIKAEKEFCIGVK
jgi:threonylcarbamoyladenosine tRNA methylthiotransferase MtaB